MGRFHVVCPLLALLTLAPGLVGAERSGHATRTEDSEVATTPAGGTEMQRLDLIPSSHRGDWRGPNRLWFQGPEPERSEGQLAVASRSVKYGWSYQGKSQSGEIDLWGPPGAVRAAWKDTWHAADGMALHGHLHEGVLRLYGTYPAGEGPEWGWRIEVDTRDPEHLSLRMFNLLPGGVIVPAVDLRAAR